ncbi:MAG: hypothetical protein HZC01_02555 [Candidatus Kerfeldbacteria bacterium]|nr:hypothetical protein [Candidatus Kerfeldbacteria bacterium]
MSLIMVHHRGYTDAVHHQTFLEFFNGLAQIVGSVMGENPNDYFIWESKLPHVERAGVVPNEIDILIFIDSKVYSEAETWRATQEITSQIQPLIPAESSFRVTLIPAPMYSCQASGTAPVK